MANFARKKGKVLAVAAAHPVTTFPPKEVVSPKAKPKANHPTKGVPALADRLSQQSLSVSPVVIAITIRFASHITWMVVVARAMAAPALKAGIFA